MKKFKSLNFGKLDEDFEIPDDGTWERRRTMGQGAYGKVMECRHLKTATNFAVKRCENVFKEELRSVRLLRELHILRNVDHACLNKLVTVFRPRAM